MGMEAFAAYETQNCAKAIDFKDEYVVVTTEDGRMIYVPLEWFPWLQNATPEERADYKIGGMSIYWRQLDEGFSMQMVLLGKPHK